MVLLDVRSPSEYATGHIVGAQNLPLFDDSERAEVGTLYKQVSRDRAVERGLEFVGPKMASLVRDARRLAHGEPIELYCARGGMRSASVGWLLRTAGLTVHVMPGGYKAYRAGFERMLSGNDWLLVVIAGATGSGKTELLHVMERLGAQVLDLEGLASHRGSVFGGVGQAAQPTTEHYINLLHDRFAQFSPDRPVFCEGESMLVGHVCIPPALYSMMQQGRSVEVQAPREERLERIMDEYGELSVDELRACFVKIAKRMGPEQTKMAIESLDRGDILTAASLGLEYYDKCYRKAAHQGADGVVEVNKESKERVALNLIERYEKSY